MFLKVNRSLCNQSGSCIHILHKKMILFQMCGLDYIRAIPCLQSGLCGYLLDIKAQL